MAEQQATPGRAGRFWREALDRVFLGNRGYTPSTNTWSKPGIAQGIASNVAGSLVPGGGFISNLWFNSRNRAGYNGLPNWLAGPDPISYAPGHNDVHAAYRPPNMAGLIGGGGPTGVAPSAPTGLAGYAAGLGSGATGLPGMVPQQPPGGRVPLDPVTLQPVDRVQHTVSTIGGSPTLNVRPAPQALGHMGGARSAFRHNANGGTLTGEAAQGFLQGMRQGPGSEQYNFRWASSGPMSS